MSGGSPPEEGDGKEAEPPKVNISSMEDRAPPLKTFPKPLEALYRPNHVKFPAVTKLREQFWERKDDKVSNSRRFGACASNLWVLDDCSITWLQNIRNDLWGSQFSQIWRHPDLDIRQKSTIYVHPSIFKGKYDFPENGDENMLAVNFQQLILMIQIWGAIRILRPGP